MRRILLVEPAYRNKYPPLGLMKISSYHKLKGDFVQFVKGCAPQFRKQEWDRVYISTLFTFHWKITVATIKYYCRAATSPDQVIVGGVAATLLAEELHRETGAIVIEGLLDKPGMLDPGDKQKVDVLTPDYQMLKQTDYEYRLDNAYIGYATRGCPNRCGFCAVSCIEPTFCNYLPLKRQIRSIEEVYGPKQHLVLLDNNVLASDQFDRIINDIIDLGFEKGATLNKKTRYVDFNQGIDIRLLTPAKMRLLAKTALKPLRLAFDHIELSNQYIDSVRLAVDCGISHLSNYVLYNYADTPQDFYERLRINVQLNQELGTQIYSFPMKYIPLDAKDRSHVGKHWNRRLLRGVQCILLATKGKVGTHLDFFEAAFGKTPDEFIEIATMPEKYIIYRRAHENNGADEWRGAFQALSDKEKLEFMTLASERNRSSEGSSFKQLLTHYDRERKCRSKGDAAGQS